MGLQPLRTAFVLGLLDVLSLQPQLDVYEDPRSSGELGLLDDPNLRRARNSLDVERTVRVRFGFPR